jgi:succinyl-CoA synthetase beta subunit
MLATTLLECEHDSLPFELSLLNTASNRFTTMQTHVAVLTQGQGATNASMDTVTLIAQNKMTQFINLMFWSLSDLDW